MLKKISNLAGVKALSKEEQRQLKGGRCGDCDPETQCCHYCVATACVWLSCSSCCSGCGGGGDGCSPVCL